MKAAVDQHVRHVSHTNRLLTTDRQHCFGSQAGDAARCLRGGRSTVQTLTLVCVVRVRKRKARASVQQERDDRSCMSKERVFFLYILTLIDDVLTETSDTMTE